MTQEWVKCKRSVVVGVTVGVLLFMGAASAHAQAVGSAAIRGRVADESGAGVPGATVTVSSPSLQLRERTVVSDQDGEYQIRSLPLGIYTVRFELTGFQTILREGIQLSAGFEARVDVVLKLSTVQEAITVSGQSPVIDVTTTTVSSNLSHEVLDTIPTSRSIGEAIALAPGVRYSGAIDVGGNRTGQFASGGNNFGSDQQSPFLEGINTRLFEGGSMAYLDQRALDEIQVTAVGSSAEFATPGVAWTGVVKSGGNDFHGLLSYDGQYPALQANNVDEALINTGAGSVREQHQELLRRHGAARRHESCATGSGSSPPSAASSACRTSSASRRPRGPTTGTEPPTTRRPRARCGTPGRR